MDQSSICRETLQSMALESCPAELFYDLSDNLDNQDETSLWILVEEHHEASLSPFLLGRLACHAGIVDVRFDPHMEELLNEENDNYNARKCLVTEWLEGWSRQYALMGE